MNSSLERFVQALKEEGFQATNLAIGEQLVIHGVAGAGKTRLLKKFLGDPSFAFYNPIAEEQHRIDGVEISKVLVPLSNKINVLDEYLRAETVEGFDILLADPFQSHKKPLKAHFVKKLSHRFKSELADLLQKLGFEVEAQNSGLVLIEGSGYEIPVEGQVIALEEEVLKLLSAHGVTAFEPSCLQGLEFKTVTFVHSRDLKNLDKVGLYLALTRVQEKLLILQV